MNAALIRSIGRNVGALMKMPEFAGLVMTIALVNKTMRDAAENPMDEWRRQNVKAAVEAAFALRLIAASTETESSPTIKTWFDNAMVGVIASKAHGDCM